MINFKIQFGYNKILYTAVVHRIPPTDKFPLQYLVSEIDPEIKNVPPVFFYDPEKETFELGRRKFAELTEKIITAIKDYCAENSIPLEQGEKHDT